MHEYRIRAILNKTRLRNGLQRYLNIMENLHKIDVSENAAFNVMYNGFYKIRQRPQEFYNDFYAYMQFHKTNAGLSFSNVLNHFFERFERIEASFSSKLLATINPNQPVWDIHVLNYLGLRRPVSNCRTEKYQRTLNIYCQIEEKYKCFLQSNDCKNWIKIFDEVFPQVKISTTKKVDLIIWGNGIE